MRSGIHLAACLCLLGTIPFAARADQVNNPHYAVWSQFKPGSSRTWIGTMIAGPLRVDVKMTSTLREVTPDHVAIDTQTISDCGQGPRVGKTMRDVEDAKIEAEEVRELG